MDLLPLEDFTSVVALGGAMGVSPSSSESRAPNGLKVACLVEGGGCVDERGVYDLLSGVVGCGCGGGFEVWSVSCVYQWKYLTHCADSRKRI